jgi:hypothetical protein
LKELLNHLYTDSWDIFPIINFVNSNVYNSIFQVQLHYQNLIRLKFVWSTKSREPILYYFQQEGLNTFTGLFFKILYFNQFCFQKSYNILLNGWFDPRNAFY